MARFRVDIEFNCMKSYEVEAVDEDEARDIAEEMASKEEFVPAGDWETYEVEELPKGSVSYNPEWLKKIYYLRDGWEPNKGTKAWELWNLLEKKLGEYYDDMVYAIIENEDGDVCCAVCDDYPIEMYAGERIGDHSLHYGTIAMRVMHDELLELQTKRAREIAANSHYRVVVLDEFSYVGLYIVLNSDPSIQQINDALDTIGCANIEAMQDEIVAQLLMLDKIEQKKEE